MWYQSINGTQKEKLKCLYSYNRYISLSQVQFANKNFC